MNSLVQHLDNFRKEKLEEFSELWRQEDSLVEEVQEYAGLSAGFLPDPDDYLNFELTREQSYADGTALAYGVGILHGIYLARLEIEQLPWYKRFLFF